MVVGVWPSEWHGLCVLFVGKRLSLASLCYLSLALVVE